MVNAFDCPYLTNDGDNYLQKMSYDTCDFYSLPYLSLYFNFAQPINSQQFSFDPFLLETSLDNSGMKKIIVSVTGEQF